VPRSADAAAGAGGGLNRTEAEDVDQLFQRISPSVVVIRARGREVTAARGLVTFTEIGSGVLVSPDGKVITAAHVVHAMDEITVEFFGGETVRSSGLSATTSREAPAARVLASR
jgi:serine protease Do